MSELGSLLDDLVARIDALEAEVAGLRSVASGSPYMSIPEAAEYLRTSRRRIDDLLSSGALRRVKEGRRTLVYRSDVEARLDVESGRSGSTMGSDGYARAST